MADHTFASGEVLTAANTNTYLAHTGGAWNSWTPTITQSGAVSATVLYARYFKAGRLIVAAFSIQATASGTGANAISIGALPVTAAASGLIVGSGELYDNSANIHYGFHAYLFSTTTLGLLVPDDRNATDNRLGLVVFTAAIANADTIHGTIMYEAATG